jgi:hypothetical protein
MMSKIDKNKSLDVVGWGPFCTYIQTLNPKLLTLTIGLNPKP